MTSSITTLTAHCLCGRQNFTTKVSTSSLPLSASTCHCTSCRHLTGALYSSDVDWPEPTKNVDLSSLSVYKFSSKVNDHFCGTCSTHMFFSFPKDPSAPLGVFTGALKNDEGDILSFDKHIFVSDTKDGGASVWWKTDGGGKAVKQYLIRGGSKDGEEHGEEVPGGWPEKKDLVPFKEKRAKELPLWCRCRGVELVIKREEYELDGKTKLPRYVDPETGKLAAEFCACDSCRLHAGIDVFHWTFTHLRNIKTKNGTPLPTRIEDLKKAVDEGKKELGTLKYYKSSPGVERYFCSSCGASVFFANKTRPEVIDVAVGLLDAEEGARAEGFLSWNYGTVDFKEDSKGGWREPILDRVEKESEEWRVQKGDPVSWRRGLAVEF